jgi:hypothetical protein
MALYCERWEVSRTVSAQVTKAPESRGETLKLTGADGSRCGIGNVGLGNNADLSTSGTTEHLEDGLNLGVTEGLAGRVGVGVEGVDGGALAKDC